VGEAEVRALAEQLTESELICECLSTASGTVDYTVVATTVLEFGRVPSLRAAIAQTRLQPGVAPAPAASSVQKIAFHLVEIESLVLRGHQDAVSLVPEIRRHFDGLVTWLERVFHPPGRVDQRRNDTLAWTADYLGSACAGADERCVLLAAAQVLRLAGIWDFEWPLAPEDEERFVSAMKLTVSRRAGA